MTIPRLFLFQHFTPYTRQIRDGQVAFNQPSITPSAIYRKQAFSKPPSFVIDDVVLYRRNCWRKWWFGFTRSDFQCAQAPFFTNFYLHYWMSDRLRCLPLSGPVLAQSKAIFTGSLYNLQLNWHFKMLTSTKLTAPLKLYSQIKSSTSDEPRDINYYKRLRTYLHWKMHHFTQRWN